ncbi:hypothetical protein MFIFM68171_03073 [Madurella fahalii]|uniref:Uncharacterized protein n=1 Tax=Madurella fahalii TaxID=1157608 RepID=A0ABQ0G514_9PEZI
MSGPTTAQPSNPASEDGEFWRWLDGYLKGIIVISVFGGQITFTVLVSDIADPADTIQADRNNPDPSLIPTFARETVRTFLGISWLLFTVSLGIAVFVKTVLSDTKGRNWLVRKLGTDGFSRLYSTLTFLLNALSVSPFLFLALATAAYLPVVGWIGTAFVSLFAIAVGIFWVILD